MTMPRSGIPAGGPARRRAGPLLLVPARWQRTAFLIWLKRIHAWTGLWGALLFLLLGSSGFLLNHRAVLKIDTGTPREVSNADVAVAPNRMREQNTFAARASRTGFSNRLNPSGETGARLAADDPARNSQA